MSTIGLAVECKLTIAQRELAVRLPGSNRVGQYATHRVIALIRHNPFAEIHHPSALSLNPSTPFCIILDGLPASCVGDQCLQMLLRITSRQIEQVDAI